MTTRYLSCADTAKLLRQALKESFPSVKFSVRSSVYSGGASIDVKWTDGPTTSQVKGITDAFEGAYFDGMIDYQGSRYHRLDGQPVHFGANFIFENRTNSDVALANAIAAVAGAYGGCDLLSVEAWKRGDGWNWKNSGGCDLGRAVNSYLAGEDLIAGGDLGLEPLPSPTLARISYAGDDGYGAGTTGNAANGWQSGQGYPDAEHQAAVDTVKAALVKKFPGLDLSKVEVI